MIPAGAFILCMSDASESTNEKNRDGQLQPCSFCPRIIQLIPFGEFLNDVTENTKSLPCDPAAALHSKFSMKRINYTHEFHLTLSFSSLKSF